MSEELEREKPDWLVEREAYSKKAMENGWPFWRVVVRVDCRDGRQVTSEYAPHRAAAKKRVRDLFGDDCAVTEWIKSYQPRDSWDCPNCGVSEGMMTIPNLRGKWDWECMSCDYRTVGHPYDPEEEAGRGSDRL